MEKADAVDGLIVREMTLENHEGEDFALKVTQTKDLIQISPSPTGYAQKVLKSWAMLSAELYEKNGRVYTFDAFGRCESIKDPNGNEITFHYNDFLELDYIVDTMDRKIHFEYTELFKELGISSVPKVKRIWVEDAAGDVVKEVNYAFKEANTDFGLDIPLPLLETATDVGGREYNYDYDIKFLKSGETAIKVNFLALAIDVIGVLLGADPVKVEGAMSKIGLSAVTVSASGQAMWAFPISNASGYGMRDTDINYTIHPVTYSEVDADDYLLTMVPTAVNMSAGARQLLHAKRILGTKE